MKNIRYSTLMLCGSFFSILINPGPYHSLFWILPFYILYFIFRSIENFTRKNLYVIEISDIFLLMFILVTLFSCSMIHTTPSAAKVTIYYITIIFLLIYIKNSGINEREMRMILNSYIVACCLISILMFFQKLTLDDHITRYTIRSFIPNSRTKDTNFLAAYMSFPLLIVVIRTIFGNKKIKNFAISIVIFLGIFFTSSRAAILFIFFSLVLIFVYYLRNKRIKTIIRSSIMIILLSIFILPSMAKRIPSNFIDRYFKSSYVDGSNMQRLGAWRTGILVFIDNPVIGKGVESQYRLGLDYGIRRQMYTHSTFIDILADYGFLGLLTLGSFLFYIFFKNIKFSRLWILALLVNTYGTAAIISALYVAYFWQNIILISLISRYYDKNKKIDIIL